MTKNIIFIIAALCSLQARADVQPTERDTVHRTYRYDDTELLQPLQPLYLDGVVVPARGNGNWFVSIAGGATAFLGTPLGCEDLFGRLKPSYSLALGKWFTPVGRCTHKLQRVAVQGRHAGRAGVPLSPCGSAVECAWRQLCPAETGALASGTLCGYRTAAPCDQRA